MECLRAVDVSPHPVTSVSVRSDGKRLAVGNVGGSVLVYRLPGFAKVKAVAVVVVVVVVVVVSFDGVVVGSGGGGGGVVVGGWNAR